MCLGLNVLLCGRASLSADQKVLPNFNFRDILKFSRCIYPLKPRAEVYCFRLNSNVSKLVYCIPTGLSSQFSTPRYSGEWEPLLCIMTSSLESFVYMYILRLMVVPFLIVSVIMLNNFRSWDLLQDGHYYTIALLFY